MNQSRMIAVVTTVFNDIQGVKAFLQAMQRQTVLPAEVVIVDGGSRDGTWEFLTSAVQEPRGYRLKVHQEAGCNVARGRDLAIEMAEGDLIVSTDIGCDWDPEWVAELSTPLMTDPGCDLVIGSWSVRREELNGPWALTEWALKGDQILEATPNSYSSSRSIAYRRQMWQALDGYPEDLTLAADDAVFHYLIEQAEVPRSSAPIVRCYWHRHKRLKSFFREAYRYGLGDGEAAIRVKDHALVGGRLLLEAVGLLATFVAFFVTGWLQSLCAGLAVAAAVSMVARVLRLLKPGRVLRQAGVDWPLYRLIVFVYGTKLHSVGGVLRGLIRGRTFCRRCRQQLREMTPQLYAQRRAAATGRGLPAQRSEAPLAAAH